MMYERSFKDDEKREETLKDRIANLNERVEELSRKKKEKKFRMPFRARVSKPMLRRGYVTFCFINENKNVDFKKEPIIDGTVKYEGEYHAVEEFDIFFYKGKPLVFQARKKLNPWNPLQGENETYGHKYIMARMKGDQIKALKKRIGGMAIFGLIILVIVGYYIFTGGFS